MAYMQSERLIEVILGKKPMHRKFLKSALTQLTDEERADAERYINFLTTEGASVEDLAECYLTIVHDTFREEMFFKETKRYRFSTYAEAATAAYDNPDYMRRYMIGLALSSFWWINHVQMRRFFNDCIPRHKGGIYREVGPGHGLYFLDAMSITNFDVYEGVDISATSVELTNRIINSGHFGHFDKARVWREDFLTAEFEELADALVMGEVLEHVENPEMFLSRAHDVTTDSAFIFLTTCFNSPAIDHIYNPESVEGLRDLVVRAGFKVVKSCVIPKVGCSIDQCMHEQLPVNVALLLAKGETL